MKNIFSRILLTILVIFMSIRSVNCAYPSPESLHTEQLIIAMTDNWNSIRAKLLAFEKRKGKWNLKFSFAAVVGERGMAMGKVIRDITIAGAPLKKEGDLKSPAGIFFMGPAFGCAAKTEATWMHMRYVRATDTLVCIDDPNSVRYNKMIKSDSVEKDWNSHEDMHRKDQDYKWGVFIQQNYHPVKPGMSSCIFLHIWEDEMKGTAGCTAMEEKNILQLLKWIRGDKRPLLVQFPESVYKKIHSDYYLPVI